MLQRIGRLNVETRRVLQQAAVIGRTFPVAVLQAISQASSGALGDHLASLERLGLIHQSGNESDCEFAFRQPLMWEVVYSTMLRRQRKAVHRRVAEALEAHYREHLDEHASSLGHHYFQAGDLRAITWLLRAAERARSVYEPRSVIEYVTMAERLSQELDQVLPANAYQVRGLAYELVGDYQSAREDFEQAVARAQAVGKLRDEWQALISLGMAWAERDYTQAGEYYRRALERAKQLSDELLLAHSLNRLGNWYSNTGVPQSAFGAHRDAVEIFDRLGDQVGLAETRDLLGMACYLAGDLPTAEDYFAQAVDLFRTIDERQGLASSLTMRTISHGTVLDLTVAPARSPLDVTQYADEALSVARQIEWEAGEVFAEFSLALMAEIRGDYGRALAHGERSYRLAKQIGHRQWTVASRIGLGVIKLNLFQLDEARTHLERALEEARQMNSDNWINLSSAILARVYLTSHERDRARDVLGTLAHDGNPPNTVARRGRWYQQAALELISGNAGESLSIIDVLLRTAPESAEAPVIPHLALLRGQALARLERHHEAEGELKAALASAGALGYRPAVWRTDLALAALYRDQGDLAASEAALARARDVIDELASAIPDASLQEQFRRGAHECLGSTECSAVS